MSAKLITCHSAGLWDTLLKKSKALVRSEAENVSKPSKLWVFDPGFVGLGLQAQYPCTGVPRDPTILRMVARATHAVTSSSSRGCGTRYNYEEKTLGTRAAGREGLHVTRHTRECPGSRHSAQAQLCPGVPRSWLLAPFTGCAGHGRAPAAGAGLLSAALGPAAVQERGGQVLGGPSGCGGSRGRAGASAAGHGSSRRGIPVPRSHTYFQSNEFKTKFKEWSMNFFFFFFKKKKGKKVVKVYLLFLDEPPAPSPQQHYCQTPTAGGCCCELTPPTGIPGTRTPTQPAWVTRKGTETARVLSPPTANSKSRRPLEAEPLHSPCPPCRYRDPLRPGRLSSRAARVAVAVPGDAPPGRPCSRIALCCVPLPHAHPAAQPSACSPHPISF